MGGMECGWEGRAFGRVKLTCAREMYLPAAVQW